MLVSFRRPDRPPSVAQGKSTWLRTTVSQVRILPGGLMLTGPTARRLTLNQVIEVRILGQQRKATDRSLTVTPPWLRLRS